VSVLFINESYFTMKILGKNGVFSKEINTVSTNGSLFSYTYSNGRINRFLIEKKSNIIDYIKSFNDSEKNTIIIASDIDPAGELIAFEIASILTPKKANIFRFNKPVESLIKEKNLKAEQLLKYCTKQINVLKAARYLEERFLSEYNKEKLEVISVFAKREKARVPVKPIKRKFLY